MGGPGLEILKFGIYISFPIGIMYYFGTNLENRFSVPDFWPGPEQSHKIPHDRDEIDKELARLKERRLAARDKRLEMERLEGSDERVLGDNNSSSGTKSEVLEAVKMKEAELREGGGSMRWFR